MRPNRPYIVIADDDPDDRDFFGDAFLREYPDSTIKYVEGGVELLQFLDGCSSSELPLVLLLDYQMYDLNGPEILRRLEANSRYKPIVKVMWSTSQRVKDMQECKRLGAMQYFVKPACTADLQKMIRELFALLPDPTVAPNPSVAPNAI